MRLFIGAFAKIYDYEKIKKDFSFIKGNWTKEENIHITYLFLGEVDEHERILGSLCNLEYKKTVIPLKGLGFFGRPPKILYAKADEKPLLQLQKDICSLLGKKSDKPFIPHVTLCRIKDVKEPKRFYQKIEEYEDKTVGELEIKVELIKSTLTPKGPIYSSIGSF